MLSLAKEKEFFGLCIEKDNLCFLHLEKVNGNSVEILSSTIVPLPAGVVTDGAIEDAKAFSALIKKAFDASRVKTKRIYVTIQEAGMMTKIMELPKMPVEQMYQALKKETERYLIFGGGDFVIDYFRLDKENVFFVALKKTISASILRAVTYAGLDLAAVETQALSLLRLLVFGGREKFARKTFLLVSITSKIFEINIIKEGIPLFTHSFEESDASMFLHEIKIAVNYWEENFPQNPIESAVIFTDDDKYRALFSELSLKTGLEVMDGALMYPDKIRGKLICSQSAAMGASLRGLQEKDIFAINLVPIEKFQRERIKKNFYQPFALVAAVLFIFFALNIFLFSMDSIYNSKLAVLQNELDSSEGLLREISKVAKEKNILTKMISDKKDFIKSVGSSDWLGMLDDIRKFIPNEVTLDYISTSPVSVGIKGRAYSEEEVYKYVNLLGYSKYFKEPKLTSLKGQIEKESYIVSFEVNCPLNVPSQEKKEEKK